MIVAHLGNLRGRSLSSFNKPLFLLNASFSPHLTEVLDHVQRLDEAMKGIEERDEFRTLKKVRIRLRAA